MVKRIVLFLMAVLMVSCGVLRPPQGHESSHRDSTVINYRDSLRLRDSLRIRDSLVLVPLPVESSQNILPSFIPSNPFTYLSICPTLHKSIQQSTHLHKILLP